MEKTYCGYSGYLCDWILIYIGLPTVREIADDMITNGKSKQMQDISWILPEYHQILQKSNLF